MPETRHEVEYATIHGHRRAYVQVGSGPVLLLLHGLGCDHLTWEPVIDRLAEHYTVLAPDLLGHGSSAKPRADYSVGGYANGMRDLLTVLGIDRVTVVGHSFGGGVAMQFAYQFPERTERMMLVSSGGLGPEVTPVIRAITTPGYQQAMGLLTLPGVRHLGIAGLKIACRDRVPTHPRPRGGRRHLRHLQGPPRPGRDPPRRARGRGLEGTDRHHGRPRLPHRRDADGRDLGPGRPGDPGPPRRQRRRPGTEGARRDHPQRRTLPAQGPPGAVRTLSCTSSCGPPRPATYSRAKWRRCCSTSGPGAPSRRRSRASRRPEPPAPARPSPAPSRAGPGRALRRRRPPA